MRRRVPPFLRTLLHHKTASDSSLRSGSPSLSRIALLVGTILLLSSLLCVHFWPNRITLRLGDIADKTITAQRTVRYEDTAATQLLRADAARQTERRYEQIPDATAQAPRYTDQYVCRH